MVLSVSQQFIRSLLVLAASYLWGNLRMNVKLFMLCVPCFLVAVGQLYSRQSPPLFPENTDSFCARMLLVFQRLLLVFQQVVYHILLQFSINFVFHVVLHSHTQSWIFLLSISCSLFPPSLLLLFSPPYSDFLDLDGASDLERDMSGSAGAWGWVVPLPNFCLSGSHSDKAQNHVGLHVVEHLSFNLGHMLKITDIFSLFSPTQTKISA